MKDFWNNFFSALYVIFWILWLSPMFIGFFMIITGHGHKSEPEDDYYDTNAVNTPNTSEINKQTVEPFNIPTTPNYITRPSKKTPDDAYSEGYDDGYEQGEYDGRNGYSEESNYDDSNNYYDYYEERYVEGYRSGYEEGYYSGRSTYEKNHSEDED